MIILNSDQANNQPNESPNHDVSAIIEAKPKTQKPSMYKVILLNDDYTPMDFVVGILRQFFNKTIEDATDLMLDIHHKGSAICGIYPYEIAETKSMQVMEYSKKHQHPLQCTIEKE